MKYLKKFELNSNQTDLNDQLIAACITNDIEKVKKLIKKGADVNFINRDGNTALIYSINNINIMNFLIKKGADVNFQTINNDGWTPLLLAGFYNKIGYFDNYNILKLLIDSGANWNIKGKLINITFLDYLTPKIKNQIIRYYPDKYKDYLFNETTDKFNI